MQDDCRARLSLHLTNSSLHAKDIKEVDVEELVATTDVWQALLCMFIAPCTNVRIILVRMGGSYNGGSL